MNADCYTCRSISGEQRISPGPIIYEGRCWLIEHAYPTQLKGWLVIVLKRHNVHFHVVAKPPDLPQELTGAKVFAMINVAEAAALPREEIRIFCEELRSHSAWN